MISWIVASHDEAVLQANLLPSLDPLAADDQIVIIRSGRSIAEAYNHGAALANQPIRCYIHHDVRVLDRSRLRGLLVDHCTTEVGIVGVIGSRTPVFPWWEGIGVGSVIDTRHGLLGHDDTGGPCAYLDGLLLASAQPLAWDETYVGWHGYDHDICQQMLGVGLPNFCLPLGRELVQHNTGGPTSTDSVAGWTDARVRFRQKWGDGHGA